MQTPEKERPPRGGLSEIIVSGIRVNKKKPEHFARGFSGHKLN
jgi:hypothetical protein